MASRLKRFFKEELLFYIFLLALFLTITALVLVLLSGRNRRESLLVEYEAQKVGSALMESLRDGQSLDLEALEQRVVGFGVYTVQGAALERFGSAPFLLRVPENLAGRSGGQTAVLRFHEERKTLALIRWLGLPPAMMEMHRRMPRMMQPFQERGAAQGPQLLYLELAVHDYWSSRRLFRTASVLAPVLILSVLAFIGYLYWKNGLYKRKLASQAELARLGEVSRTLSHEIKNPLSAIRIQTGILRRTLPEPNRPDLKIIEEEISRLSLLTDRIGDFLRDPLGEPELINLDLFVRELIVRYDSKIGYANQEQERVWVRFDRQRLRSVVENLLNNALESGKTEPSGRAPLRQEQASPVEIVLSASKGRAELAVLDRGEGIPEELLGKIFDPFYTTKTSGSGVGLSISKRFVEASGGRLSLQNRKEGGTEARIVMKRESG